MGLRIQREGSSAADMLKGAVRQEGACAQPDRPMRSRRRCGVSGSSIRPTKLAKICDRVTHGPSSRGRHSEFEWELTHATFPVLSSLHSTVLSRLVRPSSHTSPRWEAPGGPPAIALAHCYPNCTHKSPHVLSPPSPVPLCSCVTNKRLNILAPKIATLDDLI